jgi:D-xylose transport system substrate-binding protein
MLRIKAGFTTGIAIGVALAAAIVGVASSSAHQARMAAAITSSNLSTKDFNASMSAMKYLKSLAAKGKGGVYLILPDTTTSARYTQFDTPLFMKAMKLAGMKSSQYGVQNGQKSDSQFITLAEADVTKGAKVLLIDPEDAGTGKTVAQYAAAHGVKVIDYDRLTVGPYYDSFDNVFVGHLLGTGLVSCVAAWKAHNPSLAHPKVIVMRGDPTDNNATLFAQGYNAVLSQKFSSGGWTEEATPPGTWTPATAATEFTQAFTAHPSTNALLSPNDENASPIITYLQTQHVKPYTFPVTGQDATTVGLQDTIAGYQCGTVYKPVFLEAEAGAALALYVRANVKPPKSLLNGSTADPNENGKKVPSVIVTPEWVTASTIEKTIVHDHSVPAGTICTSVSPTSGQPTFAADCRRYGIH